MEGQLCSQFSLSNSATGVKIVYTFMQQHLRLPAGLALLFVCAPVSATEVIGWTYGPNTHGETNIPSNATNVATISTRGAEHSLALREGGTLVAWGRNNYGQTNVPPEATNVVTVAAIGYHSLALRGDGKLLAWGAGTNDSGSLVSPIPEVRDEFGQCIVPQDLTNAVAISGGGWHSLALRRDGTVVAWGNNYFGQCNVPASATNVVAIAGGTRHNLALLADGKVLAWGNNSYGQINVSANATNVVAIACGNYYSLVLRADGTVIGWGYNYGSPLNVPPSATNLVAIAGGGYHVLALKPDGGVVAWGGERAGLTSVPPDATNIVAIAAGRLYNLALVGDGSPRSTSPPLKRAVTVGGTVAFRALVVGASPLSYQWQLNDTNITGATNVSLTLTNVPVTDAGEYVCVVTNTLGALTNAVATLTVTRQPARFDTSPANLGMTDGGFHMRVTGLAGQGPSIIYASTNLVDWDGIFTNPPYVGTLDFLDSTATNLPLRFYKAVEGP